MVVEIDEIGEDEVDEVVLKMWCEFFEDVECVVVVGG